MVEATCGSAGEVREIDWRMSAAPTIGPTHRAKQRGGKVSDRAEQP